MITSKDNLQIKYLNSLKLKKNRNKDKRFLVFGDHLITEANKYNLIEELYTSNPNKGGTLISSNLMKKINETITPFDQLAVVKILDNNLKSDKILILEDVQDPNNVGALFRSALAFGFKEIYLSEKCADVYNDKTIRASQGAIFGLNIKRLDVIKKAKELKGEGYTIVSTTLGGKNELPKSSKLAIVLGNEGSGISQEMINLSNYNVTIKTNDVESLNVLVAGSILMYEGMKQ